MSTIVVTAADEGYAALLLDLLHSVKAAAIPDLRIGCLDLGLGDATHAQIHPLADAIVRPEWPFRAHPVFDARPRYLSRAVRPFLPRYFPGHDVYIWLDADCWVQERTALEHLAQVAALGGAAFVPAADRSYVHTDNTRDWMDRRYRMALGDEAADRLRPFNYVNSGVLALKADAPHWAAWETRFQAALDRWEGDFLSDQAVVNAVVYLDRLPSVLMPAEYNWLCHLRLPTWSVKKRRLVNPNFPWGTIGIVHNTFDDKNLVAPLPSSEGAPIKTRLTYTAYRSLVDAGGGS